MIIILILTHIGAFAAGALVFRNNSSKIETTVDAVTATEKTVVADVKDVAAKV